MKEYEVLIHGIPHTFLLDEAEAKRQGLVPKVAAEPAVKVAVAPSNKARTPENKGA